MDLESAHTHTQLASSPAKGGLKGKEKALPYQTGEAEWYGLEMPTLQRTSSGQGEDEVDDKKGWWKAWDVSADCKEIGGMECYGTWPLPCSPDDLKLS